MTSNSDIIAFLGKPIVIKIDHSLGSRHPEHGHFYPCNYGYLPDTLKVDGEPIVAYLLGVHEPVDEYKGDCIAVIERKDDKEYNLVVAPKGRMFTPEQIAVLTEFQEKYFSTNIIMATASDGRQLFPVTVHILLVENDQVFMLRRANTGYEDGNYSLVAGHLDGGETVLQAAVRETYEEAGVTVRPDDLEIKSILHRQSDEERFDFILQAHAWSGTPRNAEESKCDHAAWFPLSQLPDNTVPYIRYVIKNIDKPDIYQRYGWDPK